MGKFSDEFKERKKADKPLYKMPRTVQQAIEILNVYENGIFEVAKNRYSKTYRFTDINYTITSEAEQETIFLSYCKYLNSMDVPYKISVLNLNRNMNQIEEDVYIEEADIDQQEFVKANNENVKRGIDQGKQKIAQERFLTITIERKNVEEAKAEFATIEANIHKAFGELGSDIKALDGDERLGLLYQIYHLYDEPMKFNLGEYRERGGDYKNDLCNSMMKFSSDHFEDEGKYSRALFFKKYPASLSDRFITELTSLPVHMLLSVDVVPIPKELTMKVLEQKQLGIESDIIKQQRVRNKHNDYASDISYRKRREKAEIEATLDDVRENDSCMFYVGVTMVIMADSMEEIKSITESIITIGKRNGCVIDTHFYKQREAFNTALPIGIRQVETMRTMLTQSVAVLLPFNVQELYEPGGIYYGVNQVSKNLIVGNRKNLINGNGFYFGVPGSGKSFTAKMEMQQVWLKSDDDIIVIDPQHEYFELAEFFDGAVINLSAASDHYINPLHLDVLAFSTEERRTRITEKSEFVLSLVEQCMGGDVSQREKSIISRCVKDMYNEIAEKGEHYIPVMADLYNRLLDQPENLAKDIALALELFVNGSFDIFNHQTNIDVDNRLIVYGIRDLGKDLSPIAMLIMMESIQDRILENSKKGRATWLYVDEFHTLLNFAYTASYMNALWKKVRKLGGLCTGITQNITDILNNPEALSIISNSEFVTLMRQSLSDNARLSRVIGISDAALQYVVNSPAGTGIMKFGNTVIPFDGSVPKDSKLYQLFNTNMHEKARMQGENV